MDESVRLSRWFRYGVDVAPLVFVALVLWFKLVYFSMSLRYLWWMPERSLAGWVAEHPHIFTATIATLLLVLAFFPPLPRMWRYITLLVLNFVITTLVVANLVHVHWYGDVLSVSSLAALSTARGVMPSIVRLLSPSQAIFYIDIAILFAITPAYARWSRAAPSLLLRNRILVCTVMLLASAVLVVPTMHLVLKDRDGILAAASLQRDITAQIGILPYHIWDLTVHARKSRSAITDEDVARVRQFLSREQERGKGPNPPAFGAARGLNVIIISAESLQSFPISVDIGGVPVMPRLRAFVNESLFFERFYDQTHLGTTSDAEFMALQSLHPLSAGTVSGLYANRRFHGLPAIVAERGYNTLSACGAPPWFWNMKKMHNNLGFASSLFEDDFELSEKIGGWLSDREFYRQMLPILDEQPEPFLAFLITSSNHDPYKLPQHEYYLNLGDYENTRLGDYLHSVHYFDRAFGEFVDSLETRGILDQTMIVVYGDHQGFLGNLPELADLLSFPEYSRFHVEHISRQVPLIIRLPGGMHAGRRFVAGGHIDIAPTVMSLLGIEDSSSIMLGRNLLDEKQRLVVFRDGSFIDDSFLFLNRFGPIRMSACYRIEDGSKSDCTSLEESRAEAFERLQISDIIIRGDLFPRLRSE